MNVSFFPLLGQATLIGRMGEVGRVLGLALAPDGQMYGVTENRRLVKVNLTTGAATAPMNLQLAGGLSAAIIADFFQGLLTVVFSFILLPFVLHAVGGLSGVRETIRDPQKLSLVVPGEIDAFFIIMFAFAALIGIVAQPFIMGVCSAGRTEMDGRVGFMFGNIVKRICTIAWSLTGIAAL